MQEKINPSVSATPSMICSRNMFLHGYYLGIVHKYYLIKNNESALFIPYQLKLILEKNKVREFNKKLLDLDNKILDQYEYYKHNSSNELLSNYLLYIISSTLLTVYKNMQKNNITVAKELILYIINDIIKKEKMLATPDVSKFVIPTFNKESNNSFDALNVSDDDDDKFEGYESPTESVGELDDLGDDEPENEFNTFDLDIEQNEENMEMHHDIF